MLIDLFSQQWSNFRNSTDPYLRSSAIAYTEALKHADKIYFQRSTVSMLMEKIKDFEGTMREIERLNPYGSTQKTIEAAAERLAVFSGAWIQFDVPIKCHETMIGAMFSFVPSAYLETGKDGYYLILIDERGNVAYVLTASSAGAAWDLDPLGHQCPQCQKEYGVLLPCRACKATMLIWSEIFALSMIIAGQYLAAMRYEEKEVLGMRRIPRTGNANKDKRIPVKHIFKTIDANEIIIIVPEERPAPHETRGSWITDAEAEGDLDYQDKRTRPFTRTYRSARYVNKRGQTTSFPDGITRKQPIRKSLIGKHITKVKASDYE